MVAVDILQDDGQVGTSRGDESKMRGPYEADYVEILAKSHLDPDVGKMISRKPRRGDWEGKVGVLYWLGWCYGIWGVK